MFADTAGALTRLRTLSAGLDRSNGRPRVRDAIQALIALALLLGAGLSVFFIWSGWKSGAQTISPRAIDRLELVASVVAYEIGLAAGSSLPSQAQVSTIREKLAAIALADQRHFYVADHYGTVVATSAQDRRPRRMSDLLPDDEIRPAENAGTVGRAKLRDGTPVIIATRALPAGHVTVIQPFAAAKSDRAITPVMEAAPIASLLAISLVGAGWLNHRRHFRRQLLNRSRKHRLDVSLTHGGCGVWDWDTTRHRVFWSPSMYQLLGYEPRGDHLSTEEMTALLHPDDANLKSFFSAASMQDAGMLDREVRVRTAQGDWLWLRIKGQAITEPADGTRHIVGLAIDVTAERRAAERRAKDDMRLREAVEELRESFVLWDEEERLIVCNSKFLAMHGIAAEIAPPGTPSREIMEAARPPVVSRALDAHGQNTLGARRIETQISDGRWFHVSERRTRDGSVVSIGTDVSELKRKEENLQAREKHLQGSVRAAETAAQCYAAAAERNYEANQAKTEFLARVSHELRTPLNAIIGFSDVMRQQMLGPLDERYAGYTAGIHASGLKLLEIIDGILQMSRIEKRQYDFDPELLALDDVVQEVIESVRQDSDDKTITIEADIRGPILLQADDTAVREILVQLLRNAVKFSHTDGRVRVRVRPADGSVNVFVEDAGIGIPADLLPELGRPFAQVEAEYNRSSGGAGLGLAIAHALTDLHGGRLALRSQVGEGTIALLHLPKVQRPANDAAQSRLADDHMPPLPRARLVAAE